MTTHKFKDLPPVQRKAMALMNGFEAIRDLVDDGDGGWVVDYRRIEFAVNQWGEWRVIVPAVKQRSLHTTVTETEMESWESTGGVLGSTIKNSGAKAQAVLYALAESCDDIGVVDEVRRLALLETLDVEMEVET